MENSILLVGNHLSSSGRNVSVGEELGNRLSARGWQVLLTSRKVNRIARLVDMLSTIYLHRSAYRAAQVDVFSGAAFVWAEWSENLLNLLKIPVILTLHGGDLPSFAARHKRQVRRLLNSAAVVTTPSGYLFERMRSDRESLVLLPNAIDIAAYCARVRRNPRPHLVWLRAFHAIYNPSLAVQVLAILAKDFPDTHLAMVGPDKKDGSLEKTRAEGERLGVGDCISIRGGVPKDQVSSELDQGDIFLNTTNVDNTPVSVMEAMACGLCIISTSVGGIPYLLEHERDALLVPPDDSQAMAAAVRRVLTEPGLAAHLSLNARRKAEQFDWSEVLPQWEALLTGVIERHRV